MYCFCMRRSIQYFILFAVIFGLSCKNVRTESTAEPSIQEDATLQADDSSEAALINDTIPDSSESQKTQLTYPHPGFVYVKDYVPDVVEDIRYSTDNNFMGAVVNGYKSNVAIITKEAAERLKEAADELRDDGYVIKIYDSYRPQKAVDHFVRWAKTSDQKKKANYYPDISKKNLFPRYIASKSGHSKGSTLDLTICDAMTKVEVDMGSHFDYFGPPSHTMFLGSYQEGNAKKKVEKKHQENRLYLKRVMERHGFTNYANEWWHYTLKKEPYPKKYFDFDVSVNP